MTARPSRDALVFRALCVLDEATEACRDAPLTPPLHGLRLALTYLYTVSNNDLGIASTDREVFDAFWRTVTGVGSIRDAGRDRMRLSWAGTHFAGICRRVGVAQTIELSEALAKSRRHRGRMEFAVALRDVAENQHEAKDGRKR